MSTRAHGPCPDVRRLAPFVHPALGLDGPSDVADHLAACDACRDRAGRLRGALSPAPFAPPPAGVLGAVLSEIDGLVAREAERMTDRLGAAAEAARAERPRSAAEERIAAGDRQDPRDPMIGRTIGGYRVLARLGEGGMGMVYRGQDERQGRPVALKTLHSSLVSNESARARFEREAQAMARLQHPGIVGLVGYVDDPRAPVLVMELVEGETLEKRIERCGPIPWERCLPWFVDVCDAVDHAHGQAIIHRDLKPANIVLHPSGRAKVLDFGTARLVDANRLTQQGMTLGTIIYMSKEQLLGKPLDARSDVYSLGVTLYEALTGQLPFWDEEERKLVLKIAREAPIPPSRHYPAIPPALEAIVLRAMAKEPADRYASAAAFRDALAAVIPRLGPSPGAPAPVGPATSAARAPAPVGAAPATAPAPAPPSAAMPGAGSAPTGFEARATLLVVGIVAGVAVALGAETLPARALGLAVALVSALLLAGRRTSR